MTGQPYPTVAADDFARRFSMRTGGLMWLLGAGASAAAGIPTAWDMIWEFKQQLFVSQRRVSPKAVADLSNPAVRRSIQSFIDGLSRYPSTGAPDEYAALFEAAYPSENDRRTYIAAKLAGAKPSFGHIALASLMNAGWTRIVWTTNFDPLVADACAKAYDGTGHLTTTALDAPDLVRVPPNPPRRPSGETCACLWPTKILAPPASPRVCPAQRTVRITMPDAIRDPAAPEQDPVRHTHRGHPDPRQGRHISVHSLATRTKLTPVTIEKALDRLIQLGHLQLGHHPFLLKRD
jgi:hypothetical protein